MHDLELEVDTLHRELENAHEGIEKLTGQVRGESVRANAAETALSASKARNKELLEEVYVCMYVCVCVCVCVCMNTALGVRVRLE